MGVMFNNYYSDILAFVVVIFLSLIADPDLIRNIFIKDFQYFTDRRIPFEDTHSLAFNLLFLTGTKWKNLRQKLTPVFTAGKIKSNFETITKCGDHLEEALDQLLEVNGADIDIKEIVGRYTTDVIASYGFGLECNSLQNPRVEFREYGKKMCNPTTIDWLKINLHRFFPAIFRALDLQLIPDKIYDYFKTLVTTTIQYREDNGIKRKDFMQQMIDLRNTIDSNEATTELGSNLTLEEIVGQAFVFYLGGFETSATMLAFFFYDMAINQNIQKKIREEINAMLLRYNGQLKFDGISELTYLDKALHESLRLHPSISGIARVCSKDYKIPNTNLIIEKNVKVIIPSYGYHYDPEYYPDPEQFDPERFSPQEKEKRPACTYFAFGDGPRNCIGIRFALLETKIAIINLLKNHKFTLSPRTKTPLKLDPKHDILTVEGGIWLNAERIK